MKSAELLSVQVREVTKLYGATPALRGVTARFPSGTITLLSGANGAGKSTLLSILGTRLRPGRGVVEYQLRDGGSLSIDQVRERLGWVSHESHAYSELTGLENIRLVADLHRLSADRVEAIRQRLSLGNYAQRPISTLSRGQRQRIALARALVHQPDLLLLDEPWTGLDLKASELLERIVLEERERGAIVVVVSHTPDLARRLGARELLLEAGRISETPRGELEERRAIR